MRVSSDRTPKALKRDDGKPITNTNSHVHQPTGIEYLCENHLLQMDAQDIAHFLYKGEGLNKTAIGMC